jgi:outer membrane lipoprotein-sorting protein
MHTLFQPAKHDAPRRGTLKTGHMFQACRATSDLSGSHAERPPRCSPPRTSVIEAEGHQQRSETATEKSDAEAARKQQARRKSHTKEPAMRLWTRTRTISLLGSLLGALALSACGPDQITADEIVDRMKQSQQEIQDLHGLMAVDFVTNERSGTMLVENWNEATGSSDAEGKPIRKQRTEVRESSDPERVGTTYVSDGQRVWLYDPSENTVVTGTREELEQLRETAQGQTGADPAQAMESFDQLVQEYLDAMDIEVLPDEQVAGQSAWKLKLTPKPPQSEGAGPDLSSLASAYLWVDQQRALPLKLQADAKDAGQGGYEARSLETNQGIDDAKFSFEIPAGARVITLAEIAAELTPQTVTLDEARARVDFALLTPGEAQGATLVEVQIFKRRGEFVVVQNFSGPISFSLVQSRGPVGDDREPPAGSDVRTVTVRGQSATLISAPGGQQGTMLRWQENGVNIVIAGTLSADAAIAVAEGLR